MKIKTLATFLLITIISNFMIVSYAEEPINNINPSDLAVIEKIYTANSEILDWDIENPLSIEHTQWDIFNNEYRLTELDLSGTEIESKIDLSHFEYIECYNFSNTNINEIIFPSCISEIPQGALENCSNLEYINIPQNINKIENSAFKNCLKLKSVILNNNSITISSEAFSGCVSLECIINANNITSIGRNAFSNCNKLIFYDNTDANSYIHDYTQNINCSFSKNTNSNATGYASIMMGEKDQISRSYPYKFGIAYLYDENNNLLEQMNLNDEGKFSFSNLLIGHKYRLVIDGQFAIARNCYFILTQRDFAISSKEKAIPIVSCDFNSDKIISSNDIQNYFIGLDNPKAEDAYLYDINNDGYINISDTIILYSIIDNYDKTLYGD